jgi:hypothetical protein
VKKGLKKKGVLSLILLTVTPLLLLVLAFTWESPGANPLNLLIPHQQWWGGKSNVSDTPADSGLADLAVGGTDIHVVWKEGSSPVANIYFNSKAKDGSWSSASALDLTGTTVGKCLNPAIAVVDNGTSDRIHVVWEDYSGGTYRDILYRKSLDGGSTWDNSLIGAPDSITEDTYAYAPDIAIAGTIPHVVWQGDPDGPLGSELYKIYYSKDPDGDGLNWTIPYAVSVSSNNNMLPAIAIDGSNNIHVTWYDLSTKIIQHRRSTDGGDNWPSTITDLSGGNSTHPDIAAKGDDVYVVWNRDLGANQYEVRCRGSDDGGVSWSSPTDHLIATVTTAQISPYPSPRVSIDISDTVHVVWHACKTTCPMGETHEIWHSQSQNHGATWSSPAVNISKASGTPSQMASIGTDSEGDVHVAWQEEVSLQFDIFYRGTASAGSGRVYLPIIMKDY